MNLPEDGIHVSMAHIQGLRRWIHGVRRGVTPSNPGMNETFGSTRGSSDATHGVILATNGIRDSTRDSVDATRGVIVATRGTREATRGFCDTTRDPNGAARGTVDAMRESGSCKTRPLVGLNATRLTQALPCRLPIIIIRPRRAIHELNCTPPT